jgi:NifB/MoaA-like Fe-S oxidoreductase
VTRPLHDPDLETRMRVIDEERRRLRAYAAAVSARVDEITGEIAASSDGVVIQPVDEEENSLVVHVEEVRAGARR